MTRPDIAAIRKRAEFNNLENPRTSGERDAMLLAVNTLALLDYIERLEKENTELTGWRDDLFEKLAGGRARNFRILEWVEEPKVEKELKE